MGKLTISTMRHRPPEGAPQLTTEEFADLFEAADHPLVGHLAARGRRPPGAFNRQRTERLERLRAAGLLILQQPESSAAEAPSYALSDAGRAALEAH